MTSWFLFARTFSRKDFSKFWEFKFVDYFGFNIAIWYRANMSPSQVICLLMWLVALIMWPRRSCGSFMVMNVMFGVRGLLFIYCLVGSLHFGMVRNLTFPCFLVVLFDTVINLSNYLVSVWFNSENEHGIFEQVLEGELDFVSEPWPNISEDAKDLVRRMLVRDPKKRLTAHEVLSKYTCYTIYIYHLLLFTSN